MKHKTYVKTLLREIRGSLSRFLAIFAIVALGVGFLAGLTAASPDMYLSVDAMYDRDRMMDVRVLSTLGLTDRDVDAIRAIDGVEAVLPAYQTDVLTDSSLGDGLVARVHSLPREGDPALNQLTMVSGRMPERAGECVVVRNTFREGDAIIGETLTFSADNDDLSDTLATKSLTIVGVVDSCCYFSIEKETSTIGNGSVSLLLYTTAESFASEVYTEVYLTVSGAAALRAFTDEYDALVDGVTTRLETLAETETLRRLDEVKADAEAALRDAQATYDKEKADAEAELRDAADALEEARGQLADGERELADGRRQLADAKAALEDARKQRDDGYTALHEGQRELAERQADTYEQLTAQQTALDGNRAELDAAMEMLNTSAAELATGRQQLEAAKQQLAMLEAAGQTQQAAALAAQIAAQQSVLDASQAEWETQQQALQATAAALDAAQAQLQAARDTAETEFAAARDKLTASEQDLQAADRQIEDGEKEIAANEEKLADAAQELTDGRAELAKNEQAYADARAEADAAFADAEAELADARRQIDELEQPTWYVLDRHANVSYVSFDGNSAKVAAIAVVFPVFFFLVAALVALTTMTRMVEEERIQIGTMKALGYGKAAIAAKYMLYAGAATLAGCAVGLVIGFRVFPSVIWGAYGIMYELPPLQTPFRVDIAVTATAVAFVCTMAATLGACVRSLRECPARLMLPRAPKAGKRVFLEYITPLWSRLKFTHKVTARNLIRYKKRFFMTVIGIAGCTALLVTGFGLRDSIGAIIGKQFGEINHYDLTLTLKTNVSPDDEALTALLGDAARVSDYLTAHQESGHVAFGGEEVSAYLFVPRDTARLETFITLRERQSGDAVALTDDAVLLTEKAAEQLGVSAGDRLTLKDADGASAEVTVGGIVENYVQTYVYLSPSLYERCFGGAPTYQMIAAITAGDARQTLTADLLNTGLVGSVSSTEDIRTSFSNLITSIDYIVIVLIVSAGALAFIVLYNLTNINITERQRELATLKVLGFFDREVSAYIYRETMVLTLIGTAAGLGLGVFLHMFVVRTAEVDMVMFGRSIYAWSYVLSALLTVCFSVLVNLVMQRRLRNIDMVESLKNNE